MQHSLQKVAYNTTQDSIVGSSMSGSGTGFLNQSATLSSSFGGGKGRGHRTAVNTNNIEEANSKNSYTSSNQQMS